MFRVPIWPSAPLKYKQYTLRQYTLITADYARWNITPPTSSRAIFISCLIQFWLDRYITLMIHLYNVWWWLMTVGWPVGLFANKCVNYSTILSCSQDHSNCISFHQNKWKFRFSIIATVLLTSNSLQAQMQPLSFSLSPFLSLPLSLSFTRGRKKQ